MIMIINMIMKMIILIIIPSEQFVFFSCVKRAEDHRKTS